ncbi:hypothetical protein DYQ86_04515 [Acidobacteria bacterium AB60]|nr:hypothetical protein DYQ86_04515 [Acidobacteria bacterium AB60]
MHPRLISNPSLAAMLTVASAALIFAPPRSLAQAAPNSPNGLPDIVGLYPGMPVGDAYNLLKAYFPTRGGKVDVHQETIHGLNGDKPLATKLHIPSSGQQDTYDDLIDVLITLPPNKQAVCAVNRIISFEPGKAPSAAALTASLRQKYGPEIHEPYETRANPPTLRWIFDRQGKRVPDDFARKCHQLSGGAGADSALSIFLYNPSAIQFGNVTSAPGNDPCKTFVYVEADVPSDMSGIANSLGIYIWDLGLGLNAAMRTEAVIRGVANAEAQQAQQQQRKIDKKAVPAF